VKNKISNSDLCILEIIPFCIVKMLWLVFKLKIKHFINYPQQVQDKLFVKYKVRFSNFKPRLGNFNLKKWKKMGF